MNEIERIKKVYEKRKIEQKDKVYSYFNKGNLFIIHQREKALLDILNKFNYSDLTNKRILDVGCGTGGTLRRFIDYGAKPENLYGIDLLKDRIENAKQLHPKINFICGDASNLPYPDKYFDIVLQFTVFTSIHDVKLKKKISSEMLRVCKEDGIIIWYDFHFDNPKNPDVKGVKKNEIHSLFPNCEIFLKRITLIPPISRKLAPFSIILCQILEKIPFLCTHYIGIIRRNS
jgi:ubiquinone/menaquinone biosynthesis C-methylase UbiE